MAKKTSKKVAKKPGTKAPRKKAEPSAPAAIVAKPEIKKIQGLLKSKTADGVTLGLSMLESLGATQADYEAVFTETVIKSILGGWVAESWGAVAKALAPHGWVSDRFQQIAEDSFLRRPEKYSNFDGLVLARIPVAKAAFQSTWCKWIEDAGLVEEAFGGAAEPQRSFVDVVRIPAGSFRRGLGDWDEEDYESYINCERYDTGADLVHEGGLNTDTVMVQITKPFALGKTVVTQQQWRAVIGTEPWRYESDRDTSPDFPAVYVSWYDAMLFCRVLTELERDLGILAADQSYRLPTEAEWEYACRAGTGTKYSFGDNKASFDLFGWFNGNSRERIQSVAQKLPNPWGLFDMHGNVSEWCSDVYESAITGGNDPANAVARNKSDDRVCRGGSADDSEVYARSGWRDYFGADDRHGFLGFRVVLE